MQASGGGQHLPLTRHIKSVGRDSLLAHPPPSHPKDLPLGTTTWATFVSPNHNRDCHSGKPGTDREKRKAQKRRNTIHFPDRNRQTFPYGHGRPITAGQSSCPVQPRARLKLSLSRCLNFFLMGMDIQRGLRPPFVRGKVFFFARALGVMSQSGLGTRT